MKKTILCREHQSELAPGEICDHPVLQQIYVARGILSKQDLERDLKGLLPFSDLKYIEQAIDRLYLALKEKQHILILGDFDADGATSTALSVRILKAFGAANVSFLVPNRFEYGYGLTPEIVELAAQSKPDLIMTVDNGIVSYAGVDAANEKGIDVIVTDHHLAGDGLPNAIAVVNPNQPGDEFKSKNLAGCGVAFYVMLALRAKLRKENWFEQQKIDEPNMAGFLDIVALGTVADVVPLDKNNRILVHQGLSRIRAGKCIPGIKALLDMGKRKLERAVASDLGFAVAPRLNAAGRLDDMSLGIQCLLSDNAVEACQLAAKLENLNVERREIESEMKQQAFQYLDKLNLKQDTAASKAICLFDESWHQGVIGILASRVKDRLHRPVVIFAPGDEGMIKGSARSIQGYHIRDAFDRVATKNPGLIEKFGGHAMAAGLTIKQKDFKTFQKALADDADKFISSDDLENKIICDAELAPDDLNLRFASLLRESGPWGQQFPQPLFTNQFRLVEQRLLAGKHLKLLLACQDTLVDGILFNADLDQWPNHRCDKARLAYRLDVNEFRGKRNVQLMIEYLEAV